MSIKVKLEDEIKRKIPKREEPSFNDEIIMGLDHSMTHLDMKLFSRVEDN